MTKPTRDDLPTIAKNRFWTFSHNPKSMAKPVTLELREFNSESAQEKNFTSHSRLIGFITTTANKDDYMKAAFDLHQRVNDVDDVIGTY